MGGEKTEEILPPEEEEKKGIAKERYRDFLLYVVIFIATFGIAYSIFGMSYIPSSSMYPTLEVGHRYPYFKLLYLFKDPDRMDIIIYDKEGVAYCKRVIGIPGDHLTFLSDGLLINGEPIDTDKAYGNTYPFYAEEYDVPEGHYFVMGDNRENSNDSRYWENPYIEKKQILGRVLRK